MRPLRVGIDVSALELTKAGTARHVRALVGRLRADPRLELIEYARSGSLTQWEAQPRRSLVSAARPTRRGRRRSGSPLSDATRAT